MNADVVARLRSTFRTGRTRSLAWRREQLNGLEAMLLNHKKQWQNALAQDLGKSPFEAVLTEIYPVITELKHTRRNLKKWHKDQPVRTPLQFFPARSWVRHDPLGVVVIISPWNYPLQLQLSPLIGALAGGNCVVIKPSEISSAVEQLFAELVPRYFDQEAVAVVTGQADAATALIDARPDQVFFTGSTTTGTAVAERAARHLVPVTLELGGKSPTYVHNDVDLQTAARRIAWGKFVNAGQTCVAPDHIYAHQDIAASLAEELTRAVRESFGARPQESEDFGRMIHTGAVDRVSALLPSADSEQMICGGQVDREDRYIAPTVLYPVAESDPVMSEEIFGPVLPILPVRGPQEAAQRMLTRDTPLALYIFATDQSAREYILDQVPSGGVSIGVPVAHVGSQYLPFGGKGASGQGKYHGKWSRDTFTHQRAVLSKPMKPETLGVIYPPIHGAVKAMLDRATSPVGGKKRRTTGSSAR